MKTGDLCLVSDRHGNIAVCRVFRGNRHVIFLDGKYGGKFWASSGRSVSDPGIQIIESTAKDIEDFGGYDYAEE